MDALLLGLDDTACWTIVSGVICHVSTGGKELSFGRFVTDTDSLILE